ncbi:MAG: heme-dependent oxidative N-demethylase subunit alpha family protein, partial [Phenylobacterium sp.]|uniref:heme-dependent oxidative N-demethylase subunit alpha family protein n=1 Tax=Phenylobacterium sp. TaxID=1871053 RepID=UPI00301ABB52
ADPPWADPPGFAIGLRRIAPEAWLEGGEARPWVRKDRLFRAVPDKVWGETQGSRPGQAEAAGLVASALGLRARPDLRPPLLAAARRVPDDLVLMERRAGDWAVSALSLSAGSFFTADEALGKTLEDLHGPVPGFADRFLLRVRRIFENLPSEDIVERRNWSVVAWRGLYAPEASAARRRALRQRPRRPGAGLYIRCERQTLRRLPQTGGLLFTIRIHLTPLRALAADSEAVAVFARAWAAAPEDFRRYKGLAAVAPGVEAFLAECRLPRAESVTDPSHKALHDSR